MKKSALVISALLALGASSVASAAADPAKDAIKFREAAFTLMRANFGPMKAMVDGKAPFDKAAFAQRAANMEALSKMPWEHFIAGSDKGSESKPEVWSKLDEFKKAADNFVTEAGKLAVAAKGSDEAGMKAQFGAMAKTCKACHEGFKKD